MLIIELEGSRIKCEGSSQILAIKKNTDYSTANCVLRCNSAMMLGQYERLMSFL